MIRHAENIIKQSQDEANDWRWAKEEAKRLDDALASVRPTSDKSVEYVQTSGLQALQRKKGSLEEATTFLDNLKKDMSNAAKIIEEALSEIVAMHKAKIMRIKKEIDTQ